MTDKTLVIVIVGVLSLFGLLIYGIHLESENALTCISATGKVLECDKVFK